MIDTLEQCQLQCQNRWHEVCLEIQKIKDEQSELQLRLGKQESMVEDIQSLSKSVAILANNMDAMLREQQSQNTRLIDLERKPTRRAEGILDTIIKVILTAVMGAILVKIGLQ